MTAPLRQPIVRDLIADGWQVRHTNGGHLQARHPAASGLLHLSSTPSDPRSEKNARAQARRLLNTQKENRP